MASVGLVPQDLKVGGEPTRVVIGETQHHSRVRHHPSRHGRRRRHDKNGARNLLMANTHVAHDCQVGDDTMYRKWATLAGRVLVKDFATSARLERPPVLSCRALRFIGGYSVVTKYALPFAKTVGNRSRIYGINTIGLIRRGFSQDDRRLRRASSAQSSTTSSGRRLGRGGRRRAWTIG